MEGNMKELDADLVVLAPAIIPSPMIAKLAKVLGIETDQYGF
jgi:heterodisulfide reductase subunit A-like polyferredoxin